MDAIRRNSTIFFNPRKRLRILGLLPEFPYPPRSGSSLRLWNLYRHLTKEEAEVTLVCRTRDPLDPSYLARCNEEKLDFRVLHIPRPNLNCKLRKGFEFLIKFLPISAAGWYFPEMAELVRNTVSSDAYDIIVLESTLTGVYLPFVSRTRAVKVLDLSDLQAERTRRQASVLPLGMNKLMYLYDAKLYERFENKLIDRVDLVLTTSERERVLISKKHRNKNIRVVPNGVDCNSIRPLPMVDGSELLFVGILDYLPNIDAVVFFAEEVLPRLRQKHPELKFRVIGRNPVPRISELNGREGLEITGEVDDLEPYYRRSSICVVPLRAGSGTRLKILEAMAYGRPVVSTSLGCEGLCVEHYKHLFIADTPQDMVTAIDTLLERKDITKKMVENARTLVETHYSWESIGASIHGFLLESLQSLRDFND